MPFELRDYQITGIKQIPTTFAHVRREAAPAEQLTHVEVAHHHLEHIAETAALKAFRRVGDARHRGVWPRSDERLGGGSGETGNGENAA